MKTRGFIAGGLFAWSCVFVQADDLLDRVGDALSLTAGDDQIRAKISGSLDLEEYRLPRPAPGLIFTPDRDLFNPRLTLFLDAQLGPRVYFFAQLRADREFDPGDERLRTRLDEYALRFTPWDDGRLGIQIGKFATIVGNWVNRHHSWDNPFITAPLPYENLTGIWDVVPANSTDTLLRWAHVRPYPTGTEDYSDKYLRHPVIWGPSYAGGFAISGGAGRFTYAAEIKNASLSARPESWDVSAVGWQYPTMSGRLGFRPNEMWNLGFSVSSGPYLRDLARPFLPAGRSLADYRETVLAHDVGFARHHLQVWAEIYAARFAIPGVTNADTLAYYLEAKYKFTPQFFGALRWNQQVFASVNDGIGGRVPWGNNVWRFDVAPGYRFTAHTALKLQYSLQHDAGPRGNTQLWAAQFVARF